jgi:mevalonate kinase
MPALSASAPGKIILFGEHSVVYGRPALAAPVRQVRVKVFIKPNPGAAHGEIRIQSPSIELDTTLDGLSKDHPVGKAIRLTQAHLGAERIPACNIRISSTIPIAAGLGSGAAVSVALIRGVSAFLGRGLPEKEISELAFTVERLHHGTPSGIDNSVITYNKPIFFIKDRKIQFVEIQSPVLIVIADSGVPALTADTVGGVRRRWQENPKEFDKMFDEGGKITQEARTALKTGDIKSVGTLMDQNQTLLAKLGVSSPELDRLVAAARGAGAMGAKLSGGGGGGNIIALVDRDTKDSVVQSLQRAGATHQIVMRLEEKR